MTRTKTAKQCWGKQKRIERNVLASGVDLLAAKHHMHQFQFLPFAWCLRIALLLLQAPVIPSGTFLYSLFMSNVFEFQRTTKLVLSEVHAMRNHCHAYRSAEAFPA